MKQIGVNPRQKKFVKNLIATGGNKTKAYEMTYGIDRKNPQSAAYKLMEKPYMQDEVAKQLEKAGLPKDYFLKKMKDLAEAKNKDGSNDNRIQFDTMKIGMEMHGMLKKEDRMGDIMNINYNIDSNKLAGVLEKLAQVTKKLELTGLPKGTAEDAELIEESIENPEECITADEEADDSEVHSQPDNGGLEGRSDANGD